MSVRLISRPFGFIEPCLPSSAPKPPAGQSWLHEIKHDGFHLLAVRDGNNVHLYTRRGNDWSERYPAVIAAVLALRVGSCLIDGELVVCDDGGVSSFERLRSRKHDRIAFLYAFDLLAMDGEDLRREPLERARPR